MRKDRRGSHGGLLVVCGFSIDHTGAKVGTVQTLEEDVIIDRSGVIHRTGSETSRVEVSSPELALMPEEALA